MRRWLASWWTWTKWRGLKSAFGSPALKQAIRLSFRAVPRTRRHKSAKTVTSDILQKFLATCNDKGSRDIRDRAILMVGFASGGRRRSKIAELFVEQLTVEPPIEALDGPPVPSVAVHIGRTKAKTSEKGEIVYLTGRPVEGLNAWTATAHIETASIFRGIGRLGYGFEACDRSTVD